VLMAKMASRPMATKESCFFHAAEYRPEPDWPEDWGGLPEA